MTPAAPRRGGAGRARSAPRRRDAGVALLLVIWVLGLLAVLALMLAADARSSLQTSATTIALARARAAADAGLWLAVRGVAGGGPVGDWPIDGTPRRLAFAGFVLDVSVRDEGGKADLNEAGPALLRAALTAAGAPAGRIGALTREILQWRSPRPPGLVMNATYPGRGYGPAHAPFVANDDLLLLPGVTPALFARLRHFVTVYAQAPLIDPRAAPPALLRALPGVNPAAVASYLARRSGPNGTGVPLAALGGANDVSIQGGPVAFTIRARAAGAGVVFVRVAVIVLTPDGALPYRVVRWRQGRE